MAARASSVSYTHLDVYKRQAYHYADNFLQKGDKEAAESGAFYARIRHERYLNEQLSLIHICSTGALCATAKGG